MAAMTSPQRYRMDSGPKTQAGTTTTNGAPPPLLMPHLPPAMAQGAIDFRPSSPPRAARSAEGMQSPPTKPLPTSELGRSGMHRSASTTDTATETGQVTSGRVSRQQSLRSRNGQDVLAATYPARAESNCLVFHRGFVEKTAKYTKAWVSRHLRLEDRDVSYAVTEDSRVKGSMKLTKVERFAETMRQEHQDARDLYGMILYGDRDEKWVIRCVNEHQFRDWYGKFRVVLWQHGLAEPLDGGLGHYDPRVKLPFARIPLRELANFAKLEDAVIYGFYHVVYHVPLLTKAPTRCVFIIGDNAVYVCGSDGTILRCVPFQVMTRALWASRREGGSMLGIGALRPEPDLVLRFDHTDSLKDSLKVLTTVYVFAVKPYLEADDLEAPSAQLYVSQATYVAMDEFEPHPPMGYKLVVLVPTSKKALAEALEMAAAESAEVEAELLGVSSQSQDDGDRSRSPGSRESPGIRSNEASRGNSGDDLTAGWGTNSRGGASAGGTPSGPRARQSDATLDLTPPTGSLAYLGNHVVAMEVRQDLRSPNAPLPHADDMHSLLKRLDLLQYEQVLLDTGVDYDVLLVASPSELLRFGVRNPHHRSAIMREVLSTTAYKLAPPREDLAPAGRPPTAPNEPAGPAMRVAPLEKVNHSPDLGPQFAPPCESRVASPHLAGKGQQPKRTSRRFSVVGSPRSGVYLTPKAVRADQSTESVLDSLLSPTSESPHETEHTNSFVGGLSFAAPPDGAPLSLSFAALPPAGLHDSPPDLRNLSTVSADSL